MINRTIAIDPIFNLLSIESQWLYMRMLPFMDDYGKMTGNCFEIKYLCIPSSHVTPDWIGGHLEEMKELKLIAFENDVCVQFLGFEKNQKIGHRRAQSKYRTLIDEERLDKVGKGQNNIIEDNIKKINKKNIYNTPTLIEVEKYFKEKDIPNYKDNANKFWSHYESANWFRGKTKIKKWKMCLKNWDFSETNDKKRGFIDKFTKTSAGFYKAYCSKCGKKEFPNNEYQIRNGSSCCAVEYKSKKGDCNEI
tara:strand:- start:3038 stop:3787 length:750 start_codon:yes stop_codon:yes gene_type:complete